MSGAPILRSRMWLTVLFVGLALAGCSQSTAGKAAGSNSPPSSGNIVRPEHGGGDGGVGGM
jgi:hypothetical protein